MPTVEHYIFIPAPTAPHTDQLRLEQFKKSLYLNTVCVSRLKYLDQSRDRV